MSIQTGLTQYNLDGLTKIEYSIKLIQDNEPPEGYQLCLSAGGKDSQVAEDITRKSGAKYVIVYNRTGIDPPEAIKHLRANFPQAIITTPQMSIWEGIYLKGLPSRQKRWCCALLKEYSGKGKVLITGIRAEESGSRKKRAPVEEGRNEKRFVHPLYYWSEYDVWEYIEQNNLPYCKLYDIEGWDRIGCILCPFISWRRTLIQWQRYPKIAQAWFRAAKRHYERGLPSSKRFSNPEEFIWWWLTRGEITIENIKYQAGKKGLFIKF